jgi:hypothetical protein
VASKTPPVITYAEQRRELVALHSQIVEQGEKDDFDLHLLTVTAHNEIFTFVAGPQEEVSVRFFTSFGGFLQMVDCDIIVSNSDGWIRLFNERERE